MQNNTVDTSHIYKQEGERLHVKDNKQFLALLSGTDVQSHEKLLAYAKKIICNKAADIPHGDHRSIASWSIMKAIQSFDHDAGANFLTYLTNKIRGEISDYRSKRDSMVKKVHKMVSYEDSIDNNEAFAYSFDQDGETNSVDKVTTETPETILFSDDIYYRKVQAFRMAFSGIPSYSQYILNRLVDSNLRLNDVAEQENKTTKEITRIRNYSLSLILNRVLRSKHLTEDEKEDLKNEHGIE